VGVRLEIGDVTRRLQSTVREREMVTDMDAFHGSVQTSKYVIRRGHVDEIRTSSKVR
jgi:hypothetical protein